MRKERVGGAVGEGRTASTAVPLAEWNWPEVFEESDIAFVCALRGLVDEVVRRALRMLPTLDGSLFYTCSASVVGAIPQRDGVIGVPMGCVGQPSSCSRGQLGGRIIHLVQETGDRAGSDGGRVTSWRFATRLGVGLGGHKARERDVGRNYVLHAPPSSAPCAATPQTLHQHDEVYCGHSQNSHPCAPVRCSKRCP